MLLSDLAFPLNVYARILEIDRGNLKCLHYGLFGNESMTLEAAQVNATEFLHRQLPPACRLLQVGIRTGDTLARLGRAGYTAVGITVDSALVALAQARHGSSLPVGHAAFEHFRSPPGAWDALLFHDSAQYIEPLDLFDGARRLLGDQGEILVLDEFALQRSLVERDTLPQLNSFLSLAERFGFSTVERRELGAMAAPTLDNLASGLRRHTTRLVQELGIGAQTLQALEDSIRTYRTRYAQGIYGYCFLRLRRTARPRWRVGRISSANSAAMRELFEKTFQHPMSEGHWHWKYGGGRGFAVGVWDSAGLVAHYGGVARGIRYFGVDHSASQSCDVMVAPRGRSSLSRRGPLFLAAATYLESQVGYGNPHLLGFGFPNERAWKVPARLGLYGGPVGNIVEASWPAASGGQSLPHIVRRLGLATAADSMTAMHCWGAMSHDLSGMIVGIRDVEWLRHRYLQHPDKRYEIYVVRAAGADQPLGLFVLRPGLETGYELLDIIGPIAAIPTLVEHARKVARDKGASRVFGWFVDNIVPFLGEGAAVRDLEIIVPANTWTAGPTVDELAGKWWLTGGDADFR